VLGIVSYVRARRGARVAEAEAPAPSAGLLVALLGIGVATTLLAELWQPPFLGGPHPLANGWILVGVASAVALLLVAGRELAWPGARGGALGLAAVGVMGCVWTAWAIDRHLTDLSPHWSQKHVIASYYEMRKGPDEPLIAWQMYWRGETFYSKNAIYDHRVDQKDKTVFLAEHNAEKMQTYFKTHGGRRAFFIVERSRFESLRALLPEAARPTLKPIDETNNKVYLAVADLPASEPATPPAIAAPAPTSPPAATAVAAPSPPAATAVAAPSPPAATAVAAPSPPH
jgi:hypothetical protein